MNNNDSFRKYLSELSDTELISLLLSSCRCREAAELSEKLIRQYGSLASAVSDKDIPNENAAMILGLIPVISGSISRNNCNINTLSDSAKAKEYFIRHISRLPCEHFTAAAVNEKFRITSVMPNISGNFSAVGISTRQIAGFAISSDMNKILIAHSHPDGIVSPSENDIIATRQIISALEPLGITLIDHIIVSSTSASSMRELWADEVFDIPPDDGYVVCGQK